jgi:hypothetical protein
MFCCPEKALHFDVRNKKYAGQLIVRPAGLSRRSLFFGAMSWKHPRSEPVPSELIITWMTCCDLELGTVCRTNPSNLREPQEKFQNLVWFHSSELTRVK